jgi:dynein heavy chain, axonemal
MAIQQARYEAAMKDLKKAQDQLDDKQRELDAVTAMYEKAMREKQVRILKFAMS